MGMFDDIRCEYPLPLPEDQGELSGINWRVHGFQTKDFECLMDQYCIREDGALWQQVYEWGKTRKDRLSRKAAGWQPMSAYTGTVHIYDFIYGKQADYWVEWMTVFVAGSVTELKLERWEERDNRERLACEARWKLEREKQERFLATWIGQHLYPPYAWIIHGCFGLPFYNFFQRVGAACYRIGRLIDQIGDRLAPFGDPIRAKKHHRAWKEWFDDDE